MRGSLDMLMYAHTNRIARARFGVVSAADAASGLVKVRLQPENTETGWICDTACSVGSVTLYAPSAIGTHVLVETAQGDGDNYVVVARVFDATSPPPEFAALGDKKLTAGQVGIQSGSTEFVMTNSGISMIGDVSIQGDVTVSGRVTAKDEVTAAGIALTSHVHGGVKSGPDTTSGPQ
ncbi:phage baseplate assembly protein V [Acetobacter estunensis]|uniref:phage baseplate assembly protein V n=1 Tax=Acetobacter estunensis TaxID=104097 RepID=UPI00140A123B|nr:phage baseplate assembly protein V [Acetobacter estunensis]